MKLICKFIHKSVNGCLKHINFLLVIVVIACLCICVYVCVYLNYYMCMYAAICLCLCASQNLCKFMYEWAKYVVSFVFLSFFFLYKLMLIGNIHMNKCITCTSVWVKVFESFEECVCVFGCINYLVTYE